MATITPTIDDSANDFFLVTWAGITENDTPAGIAIPGSGDRTVQMYGTAGGVSFAMHGSLSASATYGALDNAQGDAIALTTDGQIETVMQAVHFLKPVRTGGSSTDVTILVSARKR